MPKIKAYRCLNSDTNHIQNMRKIIENPSKLIENPSKINPKRPQIQKNPFLEWFRRQIAPRSALGRSWSFGGLPFFRLFGRKCRLKGRFSDLLKIENRSQNALSRIDGHLDPLKMASGRVFGKNMKIGRKIDAKMGGF